MERFKTKNAFYPLIGFIVAITTLIFGLVVAKDFDTLYFCGVLWLLFLSFGYWRACFGVLPIIIVMCGLFGGITYAIGENLGQAIAAINRSLAVCLAFIPGLSISTTLFVRNLEQIKVPHSITLGMMITLNFFPLFGREIRQIREAMKTRGAGSILNPSVFYRAFLVPLIVRIVNISDTLALSVETRGFTMGKSAHTIYEPVKIKLKDILFLLIFIVLIVLTVVL